MDYLRAHATASAIGLYVICRHLSVFANGRNEDELQGSLEILRGGSVSQGDAGAVLTATLAIGDGLGILLRDAPSSPWTLDPELAEGLHANGEEWPWFRGELLRRISRRGADELESQGKAPDVVVGLTWFLQLSPLAPIPTDWGKGPEPLASRPNAIERSEQWRPFVRWAVALGLARRADTGAAKVIIPDATTAITDQLKYLPTAGSAQEWLGALREAVPVLGSATLLEALPQGGSVWSDLPPGLVLGLLKLSKMGTLSLEPSDDASDVVSIGLGDSSRQVGRITVGAV